jgi:hypothetical protein
MVKERLAQMVSHTSRWKCQVLHHVCLFRWVAWKAHGLKRTAGDRLSEKLSFRQWLPCTTLFQIVSADPERLLVSDSSSKSIDRQHRHELIHSTFSWGMEKLPEDLRKLYEEDMLKDGGDLVMLSV